MGRDAAAERWPLYTRRARIESVDLWHYSARVAVKRARALLRHSGGRIWVFRPDGRFYREICVR